ncbi:MAG: hypothetical protein LBU81_05600 [Methanosarcinales archaeon]|jgi:DNA-binding Lrp family transcriptional regulator|nr:hypothetical protein [Methanosarcinales archaeon]
MSTTAKKESTKKESTKSAKAKVAEASVNESKTSAPKKAPQRKTAASAPASNQPESKGPSEKTVKKIRAEKTKAAEVIPAEETAVKTKTARQSKTAEKPAPAEEPVEKTAAKRTSSHKKKADEIISDAVDSDKHKNFADLDKLKNSADSGDLKDSGSAKKPGRKSKKDEEKEIAESDDGADIETRVYNLIKNASGPVYQNNIWKQLNIDSRKCSRILKKLMDSGQILREEAVVGGSKTYLLKTVAEERKKNYDVLMVKGIFSPCTGCIGECRPEYCPALTLWILNIHEKPEEFYAAMGCNSTAAEPEHSEIEMPPEFLEGVEADAYELSDEELVFE